MPAFAGMTEVGGWGCFGGVRREWRGEEEIPAFAGMTGKFAGMTGKFAGMTGKFAGMTG
jgi:hypothetical protein